MLKIVFCLFLSVFSLAWSETEPFKITQTFKVDAQEKIPFLFAKSIEQMEKDLTLLQTEISDRVFRVVSIPKEERSFENTVLELDRAMADSRIYSQILGVLEMLHPNEAIRNQAQDSYILWGDWMIDLFNSNPEVIQAFKEYKSLGEPLNEERLYYLDYCCPIDDAPLSKQEEELQKKIQSLSVLFEKNIAEDGSFLPVKKEDLLGINEQFIQHLTKEGENYLLFCDYPTRNEILENCEVESTRRDYFHLFFGRAYPENFHILNELINLRDELARMNGCSSWAEFDMKTGMVKNVEALEDFLKQLFVSVDQQLKDLLPEKIEKLPETMSLNGEGKLNPWDLAYIMHQKKKKLDEHPSVAIKDYFPMEKVLKGLLSIYSQFFDLQFNLVDQEGYWCSKVMTVEVKEKTEKEAKIGYILLDLFPRRNKFTHACCCSIIPPLSSDQGKSFEPALAVVITNFSPPTENLPSLLSHREVVTLFHEFGHAVHALLGRAEMPTVSAYNTTTDFVEAPSQLLENWVFEPEILEIISSHYLTGESLPQEILHFLQTQKECGYLQQTIVSIGLAEFSLDLFKEGQNKNLALLTQKWFEKMNPRVSYDPQMHFVCTFGHLIGYGPKYYSYVWSNELARKMFAYIKGKQGLLDPKIGRAYVQKILAKGGSCDPARMVEDFIKD